jgi:hypothetical protein
LGFDLAEPRGGIGPNYDCFPWQPLIVKLGLKALPSGCRSLELDMLLQYWPFDGFDDEQSAYKQCLTHCTQLEFLSLLIQPYN